MIGKVHIKSARMVVVPPSREALERFTREELREYAKDLGLERGRDKKDTIDILLNSRKATLCASLGN